MRLLFNKKLGSKILVSSLVGSVLVMSSQMAFAKDGDKEAALLTKSMQAIGQNVNVQALEQIKEVPGFYVLKVAQKNDTDNVTFVVSNGDIMLTQGVSLSQRQEFVSTYTDKYIFSDMPIKDLSLVAGDPKSKNAIVMVEDFQCPYCRKAHFYLMDKLKDKKDYAIYIMHLPLTQIHNKAMIYARVFEAGVKAGDNFEHDLMGGEYDKMSDDDIIKAFASKSKNKKVFMDYMQDDDAKRSEIISKIRGQIKRDESYYHFVSTPTIIFNGQKIVGSDEAKIDDIILSKITK